MFLHKCSFYQIPKISPIQMCASIYLYARVDLLFSISQWPKNSLTNNTKPIGNAFEAIVIFDKAAIRFAAFIKVFCHSAK